MVNNGIRLYVRAMNGTATPPEDQTPPPPLPPAAGSPRTTPTETRPIFGGVCALLGDRLGVDPLWFRIGFVLAALADGLGLVIYAALWLMLIAGRTQRSVALGVLGGLVLLFGLPLVVGGLILDGPLVVLFLLTGLAVALWQPRRERSAPASHGPFQSEGAYERAVTSPPVDTGSQPSPSPRRESSPLGALTMGAAITVASVGALVDQANGGRLHPEQWLGAAAVVLGIGLLVGTVRGHARWLIIPAVILAGVGAVGGQMARLGIGMGDGRGDRWIGIHMDSSGTIDERISIGELHINIDDVPAQAVTVNARVALGDIGVTTADFVAVDIYWNGEDEARRLGRADGPADVTIDARVGYGGLNTDTYSTTQAPADSSELDERLGRLQYVDEGVHMTDDGWFVLGDGEAVIDADDQVVHGDFSEEGDGITFYTSMGEFRLLPRGLLITPWTGVVDLHTVRSNLATTEMSPTDTTSPEDDSDGSEAPSTTQLVDSSGGQQ